MKLQKLRVTIEPFVLHSLDPLDQETALVIDVEIGGRDDLQIRRIMPENDFESYFDYIWNECKKLIDAEISDLEEERDFWLKKY